MGNQYSRTLIVAGLVALAVPATSIAATIRFDHKSKPLIPATKTYLCIADKAVGFEHDNGAWNTTEWRTEGSEGARFLVKPNPDAEQAEEWPYVFHEFGNDWLKQGCSFTGGYDDADEPFYVFDCGIKGSSLKLSTKSGRFILNRIGGYVYGPEYRVKTPAVLMIGTCDAVN